MAKKKENKVEEVKKVKEVKEVVLTQAEEVEAKKAAVEFVSTEVAPQEAFGKLSRAQVNLIKRTVAQGASDDELRLFIQVCKGANLNPFLRQAHLVPFWDSKNSIERRAIIVGIDGFRAIAESSGQYAGNDDPVLEGEGEIDVEVWGDDKKKHAKKITVPKKATVTVYKVVAGVRNPFTASARWDEYYPGPKKGNQWHRMPNLMLGKCAEALALRKAFPKLLSGMYEDAEFSQANAEAAQEQRQTSAFSKLMASLDTATAEQLREYIEKLGKSDKYTEAQKKKYVEAAEKRIQEIELAGQ